MGGDSSGGEIALVVAHLCRDDKMAPPLTGVYAAAPGGVNEQTVPEQYRHLFLSEEQNADAPVLTAESLQLINSRSKRPPSSLTEANSNNQLHAVQTPTSATLAARWGFRWRSRTTAACPGRTWRCAGWTRFGTRA